MKIRNGFVSNSSSSSFLIVGISGCDNSELMAKFMKAENKEVCSFVYGVDKGELISFFGQEYEVEDPSDVSYAGIEIEKLMSTMLLPEIKKYFQKLILDKYKIEVPDSVVELYYGEIGE